MDLIVLAIPVFVLLIGIELLFVWIAGKDYYRLSDTLSDLSCGILDQVVGVFLKTAAFAGYAFVYEHLRVATLPGGSVAVWAAGFLGVDFLYYWFHRTSHEVNAFWAAHVVHHQSEDFNLAVALRQGALQGAVSWVFYLPLAWLGVPPLVFLTLTSINTLYQFWIHTRTIGKLGPLEWVLVSSPPGRDGGPRSWGGTCRPPTWTVLPAGSGTFRCRRSPRCTRRCSSLCCCSGRPST